MSRNLEQVTNWILTRNAEIDAIDPDCDLIESRLVDSLDFVQFLILIEQLSGKTIDIETLDIDDFRSLNRIQQNFFAPATPDP